MLPTFKSNNGFIVKPGSAQIVEHLDQRKWCAGSPYFPIAHKY